MWPRDRTSTRRSAHVRGHRGARRLAQAVALCLAAAGACKAGHKPKTEDHFYQLARAELAAGESCPRTREYLDTLAHRLADKAKQTGRVVSLNPMSPRDRRIVHLTLQDDPTVTTRSQGDGYLRKILIMPADRRSGAARPG